MIGGDCDAHCSIPEQQKKKKKREGESRFIYTTFLVLIAIQPGAKAPLAFIYFAYEMMFVMAGIYIQYVIILLTNPSFVKQIMN